MGQSMTVVNMLNMLCFKKSYRNACNNAVQLNFNKLNSLCRQKRTKTFWNKVRPVRNPVNTNYNCITCTTESLENYFAQMIAYNNENELPIFVKTEMRC